MNIQHHGANSGFYSSNAIATFSSHRNRRILDFPEIFCLFTGIHRNRQSLSPSKLLVSGVAIPGIVTNRWSDLRRSVVLIVLD